MTNILILGANTKALADWPVLAGNRSGALSLANLCARLERFPLGIILPARRRADIANGMKLVGMNKIIIYALCVLGCLGCQSTDKPASASFASVVISGNTPGQIHDAAIETFRQNGYKAVRDDQADLVFEKEASRMNNFVYGSWLGDTGVWLRVKAAIVPLGEMTYRLQCNAYLVQDRGSATEEETAVSHLRRGPYQKLLNAIAKQLAPK